MPGRVLVVHASNQLERGFRTVAPDRAETRGGESTAALLSLTRGVLRGIDFKVPERAVAVVDADHAPDDAALRAQVARMPALLAAHGLPVVEAPDAIHVVASYVRAARDAGHDVVVVGSDKRLAQLVGDDVWWYDATKDVRYTPDSVRKRFEVAPALVDQWLAMVGDRDEGVLGGVAGIGKKGATTLLETFGSVAAALEDLDAIKGRTGNALRAAKDTIGAELARARLDRGRALPTPLDALAYSPPDPDALRALYDELGFVDLLPARGEDDAIEVAVVDSAEVLQDVLRTIGAGPVAVQAVTEDPSPARGALVGLALATPEGAAWYVPLDSPGPRVELEALRGFLEDASVSKLGHDVKAACVALARRGVTLRGVFADSGCASHLNEPSRWFPQDLAVVARKALRRALPEDDAVRGVGRRRKRWARVKAAEVAAHFGRMADASLQIWRALEPTTDRALLDEYLALSDTLVRMELAGFAVDGDDLAATGEAFEATREQLAERIHELAGRDFNINSTKQLGEVLFDALGLTVVSRTKTGWSTATWALERIAAEHPIVPLVIEWRTLRRLQDTWVTALRADIEPDGRVRSTFHPARSFSGRLVNSAPDLGRVPGKTETMSRIRHAFTVAPGHTLLSVDYRQLGLYVLAHLTKDPALVEPLREEADMHALTAAAVLDRDPGSIDRDARQLGKVVNFATFAGQGASALASQLGVEAAEAKRYIERFDRRYAIVREFQDEQLRLARERGYIVTIAGRRWPIGDLESPDPQILDYAERLARRATHEASVADVTRRGLLHADRALRAEGLDAFPLLQIHDEILFEVATDQLDAAAEVAADAMRNAYALEVPLRVGLKAGPNWADLAPLRS